MKNFLANLDPKLTVQSNFQELTSFIPIQYLGVVVSNKELKSLDLPSCITPFSRLNLIEEGKNENVVKQKISSQRMNYDIISVEATSSSLASYAARDRRVDIIRVTPSSKLKVFNTRFGRRIDEYGKIVEIDISFFWERNFAKNARSIWRILKAVQQCSFPIILSHSISRLEDMRSYPGLQALARNMGLSNQRTKSQFLIDRIEINRKKKSGQIPIEGVEVIEW